MINDIQIITKSTKTTEENTVVVKVGPGKSGQPTIIKAQSGATYELRDIVKNQAPDQVLFKRKGKDLHILINAEGIKSEKDLPADIIIENYYGEGKAKLVGIAEDGEYYTYLPQEGTPDLLSWKISDGEISYQSLGELHEQVMWWPFLLGAGLVGAAAGGGGGGSDPQPIQHAPVAAADQAVGSFSATGKALPITVNVVSNDSDADGNIDKTSIKIVNPPSGSTLSPDGKTLTVPGQGTWVVNNDGTITFTPEPNFKGDPTPISYTVSDTTGQISAPATVTVDYPQNPPVATNDTVTAPTVGTPVTVNVLGNDTDPNNNIDPTSVKIVNPPSGSTLSPDGKTLTVPGQGTWVVNNNGTITFTPEPNFKGDPTPISYTVSDTTGQISAPATVTVDYPQNPPVATNDTVTAPTVGTPVTVNVLDNDSDVNSNIDTTTVQIVGGTDGGKTLVVPGEGTWTVNPTTGAITFTPQDDFNGDCKSHSKIEPDDGVK